MFKTRISEIELLDSGILLVKVLPDIKQTLEWAQENMKQAILMTEELRRPLLLDLRNAESLPHEVRRYYASKEVSGHFSAIALIVEASPFGQSLGNFYLNVTKNKVSKKLFSDRERAEDWLREFL